MSLNARRELLHSIEKRYRQASKKEKSTILNEFTAATGYHRKHAISILAGSGPHSDRASREIKRTRSTPPRVYTDDVREALISVWQASNRICSKRLVPYLPEWVEALERHGHLDLSDETRKRLLAISPATSIDFSTKSVTGVSLVLKQTALGLTSCSRIAYRFVPFADWKVDRPGFLEADLVAHCGTYTGGTFVNSLVLTDIMTGWTECLSLLYKDQEFVIDAFEEARKRFPFPIVGLDTDNGSEFITYKLWNYCRDEKIIFTRSRPWKKNDQCFVEQKNGHLVRRLVGYNRFEGMAPARVLSKLYDVIRLYVNFFQPSMKLISKSRNGAKVHRLYDQARTPYDRVLTSDHISKKTKRNLRRLYLSLDPVALLAEIEKLQEELWRYAHREVRIRSTKADMTPNDLQEYVHGDGQDPQQGATDVPELSVSVEEQPRRTYRKSKKKRKKVIKWWRSRPDPFAAVKDEVRDQLEETPYMAATVLLERLQAKYPGQYEDKLLRTLLRRVKAWRLEQVKEPKMSDQPTEKPEKVDHLIGAGLHCTNTP